MTWRTRSKRERFIPAPDNSTERIARFVLQPNGQIDQAEGYRNLIVARNKDRSPVYLRDIAEVKQSVQDERTSRFFWVRGFNPPGSIVVLAVSRQAGANAVEVANSVKALFPELRASLPGSITFTAGVRSFPDDCEFRSRRPNDAHDRVRAGSDGDLRFSRPRHRHADSGGRATAFVAAHVRGDEHARILDQQSDVDGADTRHRVPGRRRDRVFGKRDPPRRAWRIDSEGGL